MYLEAPDHIQATLARSHIDEERTAGAVFVSVRLPLSAPGESEFCAPLAHMASLTSVPFAWGCSVTFAGTLVPTRPGSTEQRLVFALDEARRELDWLGHRSWTMSGGQIRPGAPEPLEPAVISPRLAFGGSVFLPAAERNGLPAPAMTIHHPRNPEGVGYHPMPSSPLQGELPSLEWSHARLSHPSDLPPPAVICPTANLALCMPSTEAERETESVEVLRARHPAARSQVFASASLSPRLALWGFGATPSKVTLASPIRVTVDHAQPIEVPGSPLSVHVDLDAGVATVLFRHSLSAPRGRRRTLVVWDARTHESE